MTPVRLERDAGLAVLTLDAPPLNLFDVSLIEGLRTAIDELAEAPARALLIRAEGSVVTGGVDVGRVFDGLDAAGATALWKELLDLLHALEALPFPTVFAAHALCLTAGFELALGCDLLLAADSAQFGLVEAVVGITPSMGGTQRLAARAGPARARELVMTGRLYDAATLERWNVVNRVLPDADFDQAARRYARRLADGPTRAHAATKRVVQAFVEGGVAQADAELPELAGELFATRDAQAAVRSFVEHGPGKATFSGT